MKELRNMRELKLKKQNLKYKLQYLEDKLKDQSEDTVKAFTGYIRNLAFETGMKIVLSLLFRKRKHQKSEKPPK